MLAGLGRAEVDSIVEEQGKVEITCEFCDSIYNYDKVDVAALFKGVAADVVAPLADEDGADVTRH